MKPVVHMKPAIRIVHNLARTGGTIINRCLACMDGVALLSEIHPDMKHIFDPLDQAMRWHSLVDEEEQVSLRPMMPEYQLGLLNERAAKKGKALVVRSWDHVDFVPSKFNHTPCMCSTLADQLGDTHGLLQIAIVREPTAMWMSLAKMLREDVASGTLTVDNFLCGYRAYAELALMVGFVRYEDFCREPTVALRAICGRLELPYDQDWPAKWVGYRNLTGDPPGMGRAEDSPSAILPASRPPIPDEVRARFVAHPDYLALRRALGY